MILNYRSTEDTLECLRAVLASTELDQQIIVDDNTESPVERDRLRAQLPQHVEYTGRDHQAEVGCVAPPTTS